MHTLAAIKQALLFAFAVVLPVAHAQWQMLNSKTAADLESVDTAGNDVVWASGANGTVLRTEDGGRSWQLCAVPPDGENLTFRGVQAFHAQTAVVMSGGKGAMSRLYKTTDGCHTWKKVFENSNATGSFESLRRLSGFQMYLLGDPADGKVSMFTSGDAGDTWSALSEDGLEAPEEASDRSVALTNVDWLLTFGSVGNRALVYTYVATCDAKTDACTLTWRNKSAPLAQGSPAANNFVLAGRTVMAPSRVPVTGLSTEPSTILVAVGGDETKAQLSGAAATSTDSGATWQSAAIPPGGYRSAIAYDPKRERFISIGPNGTDVSYNDGRDWLPLRPGKNDPPGTDQQWNAMALPFVVGAHGRIGKLQ